VSDTTTRGVRVEVRTAYTSFCPLPTPIGSMRGTYRMVTAGGSGFDAEIAPFSLAVPTALN